MQGEEHATARRRGARPGVPGMNRGHLARATHWALLGAAGLVFFVWSLAILSPGLGLLPWVREWWGLHR